MSNHPLATALSGNFAWNAQREAVAIHIAQGKLSWKKIGDEVGISHATIWSWYQHPDFKARVEEHKTAFAAEMRSRALATHEGRLDSLYNLRDRIMKILEERQDRYDDKHEEPGMGSGLLNESVTIQVSDDETHARVMRREYRYESSLVRDLTLIETQIAKELGQYSEKAELTIDGPAVREFKVTLSTDPTPFDMDDLNRRIDAGSTDASK
jgi:hypothetical protein